MNSDSDCEYDESCPSSDPLENTEGTSKNSISEIKSKKKYEMVYKSFMDWRKDQNINSFSENVLLSYFGELSQRYKASSLWALYSMLKNTLDVNNNVNIDHYSRLRTFLKRRSEGYQAKKSKTFTPEEVNKFIDEAPDNVYLTTKVALIMGLTGGCRIKELYSMNTDHIQDLGSALLVTVPNINTKTVRKFTITGRFYHVCKKYTDIRSTNIDSKAFFLNCHKGKCSAQQIGINKFGSMGKQVAMFLQLPDPEMYTGHSFRKSSTTLYVDANGEVTALKRRCSWNFPSVSDTNVDDPPNIKMETESANESYTPSDTLEDTKVDIKVTSLNLLPEKSGKKYEKVYKDFMDWRSDNNMDTFSENVVLTYFRELSRKYKSSSLWTHYSMLRSTLGINNGINIENYPKVRAFLKCSSEGYQAKKAKTFTLDEINEFINEAPDNKYLATKVALIMGIMGSCRLNELHAMNIGDVQDLGSAILVTVPDSKTKNTRKFTITGRFYHICKKYVNLRPTNITFTSFFLSYQNGKCSTQQVGINKFGTMGKQIATFLKLPNPEMYTGHSFRKSSAAISIDANGDIVALKKDDGWKSAAMAEKWVDDSVKNGSIVNVTNTTLPSMTLSTYSQNISTANTTINLDASSIPLLQLTNCSNITINFVTNK